MGSCAQCCFMFAGHEYAQAIFCCKGFLCGKLLQSAAAPSRACSAKAATTAELKLMLFCAYLFKLCSISHRLVCNSRLATVLQQLQSSCDLQETANLAVAAAVPAMTIDGAADSVEEKGAAAGPAGQAAELHMVITAHEQ